MRLTLVTILINYSHFKSMIITSAAWRGGGTEEDPTLVLTPSSLPHSSHRCIHSYCFPTSAWSGWLIDLWSVNKYRWSSQISLKIDSFGKTEKVPRWILTEVKKAEKKLKLILQIIQVHTGYNYQEPLVSITYLNFFSLRTSVRNRKYFLRIRGSADP